MKKLFFIPLFLISLALAAKDYPLSSPSGKIMLKIHISNDVKYSLSFYDEVLIEPSAISLLTTSGINPGEGPKLSGVRSKPVNETIEFIVPRKFKSIPDIYNETVFEFRGNYRLEVRVYDDGAAFRWVTGFKGDMIVQKENVNFIFPDNWKVWFPEEKSVYTHQEQEYLYLATDSIEEGRFSAPTAMFETGNCRFMIVESGVRNYPGMYLESNGKNGFRGKFPGFALETIQTNALNVKVEKYADYIAEVSGKHMFPWRAFILAKNDSDLLVNELVYKLAPELEIADPSWIKPGKVAWDWWHANNIYGVAFKAGINTDTYKYYIDFASENELEYIILDAGWSPHEDVLKVNDEINMTELIRYGNERNVGIVLWVAWKALDDQMDEAMAKYESWGIKGLKIDFMQRDDQWMVDYYWRVAKKAAEHKLLVDYHGSYKPDGLRRAYPNVLTREGVIGMEVNKWSDNANPDHNTIIPFTRMVLGPMDYTPGAMKNAIKRNFRPVYTEPMSSGTRCHQLALYVVFESPMQMLADNPSNYKREPECMEFLSKVPSVWDNTRVLEAKAGEYVLLAREKDNVWYLGGITNWENRNFKIKPEFLPEGKFKMTEWKDGVNADRYAADYKKESSIIDKSSVIEINMAPGGGWAAIIELK